MHLHRFCVNVDRFIGWLWKLVHCKHLYYILQIMMLYGLMEMFIHHLIWSWDKVHKLTSWTTVTKV